MVYVNTHGFMLDMQFFILLLADFRPETPNTNLVNACYMSPENKFSCQNVSLPANWQKHVY